MRKTVALAALVSILGACGRSGLDGNSCTVADNGNGTATIACTDGTQYTVGNGKDGTNGVDGTNGANGTNGVDGTNGTNGTNGVDGKDGKDGTSCTLVDNGDWTGTITCPDGSSATIATLHKGLKVERAWLPASGTYVKGASKVPALGIALTAGMEDIVVDQLAVRFYSNSANPWANALGDRFAIADIESAMLYAGVDVVGGPQALTLVDKGSSGYTPGVDWYKVQFSNLGLRIPKGTTLVLTPAVKLLNSMVATTYVAADLVPPEDIVALDPSGNTVTPIGSALNGVASHNPMLTIVTSGTLSAVSEGSPEGGIVVAGSTMQLASKVRFSALREGFNVNKLTVINDAIGPFDAPLNTVAVGSVVIRYPDMNGVVQTRTNSLSNGSATFAGLDFYVPAGQDAYIEVYANVNSMLDVGETLSGKTFRLGILDTGNTVSTFEAVGATTSTTMNDPVIANGATVNSFTVRKSKLTFAKSSGLSTNLVSGQNRLYGFGACADIAGAVSFGKLTFEVVASSASLSDFHVVRGYVQLDPAQATITVVGNHVMVAFLQEETIGAGSCGDYYLDGTVAGVTMVSSLATKLIISTTSAFALPNPCANPNTGYVYGFGGTSIFVNSAGFVSEDVIGAELVWSDRSADAHSYPVVTAGQVAAGSGSCDWTNGWGLGTSLPTHTLSR